MPRGSAWVGIACLLIGSTVGAVAGPRPACACDCVPITPSEAEADAGVVFVGTATRQEGRPDEGSPDPVTYVFEVETVLKGVAGPTISVRTNNSSAACGVEFQVGQRYEVFAIDADGTPFVTSCGGTHQVSLPQGIPPRQMTAAAPAAPSEPASQPEAIEENSHMPVEGVIAAVGIIAVLVVAIVLVSRSRRRE